MCWSSKGVLRSTAHFPEETEAQGQEGPSLRPCNPSVASVGCLASAPGPLGFVVGLSVLPQGRSPASHAMPSEISPLPVCSRIFSQGERSPLEVRKRQRRNLGAGDSAGASGYKTPSPSASPSSQEGLSTVLQWQPLSSEGIISQALPAD